MLPVRPHSLDLPFGAPIQTGGTIQTAHQICENWYQTRWVISDEMMQVVHTEYVTTGGRGTLITYLASVYSSEFHSNSYSCEYLMPYATYVGRAVDFQGLRPINYDQFKDGRASQGRVDPIYLTSQGGAPRYIHALTGSHVRVGQQPISPVTRSNTFDLSWVEFVHDCTLFGVPGTDVPITPARRPSVWERLQEEKK